MISFISFMTTSKWGNRFRHPIRLFIWGPPLNDTAKLFADFLRRHNTDLKFYYLSIAPSVESFLQSNTDLSCALSSLSHIDFLYLGQARKLGLAMLQNGHFTKTITHIAIRLPRHGDPTVAVRSRDPTQILPHSLPALQSLIVFYAQMDHLDPSAGSNCAFPNVHTLVLFTAGQLISHHLAKTFPNVKDLVLIREAGAKPRDQSYCEVSGSLNRQMQADYGS